MSCRSCRSCGSNDVKLFLDLGFAPLSNAYLSKEGLSEPEVYYPLRVGVCRVCWLAQTEDYANCEDIFSNEYAYLSSASSSWLAHAKKYVDMITPNLGLSDQSFVVEIASNDGYLLQNFIALGVPCLGVEPTESTASIAEDKGINVVRSFFGEGLAKELLDTYCAADLIIGNNVFAHVPDINDFARGIKTLLKSDGTFTLEFPHLVNILSGMQFDTVYHEHFSYLSLTAVKYILERSNLKIYKVDELDTHGGSLRVYGCHQSSTRDLDASVASVLNREVLLGLTNIDVYLNFQEQVVKVKNEFVKKLVELQLNNSNIVAYGAAAKGNTLLNYAGIKSDLISCVFDASIYKQGRYLPGSHIPIYSPSELVKSNPDYVVILPWNIKDEIIDEISTQLNGGVKYITAIPSVVVESSSAGTML